VVPRGPLIAGAAVDPDGSVLVVLDPSGLVATARALRAGTSAPAPVRVVRAARAAPAASVLVVDDALTIRELQRSLLQRAGYDARVAADGAEALRVLRDRRPDVVVTDVEMPVMDGVALTVAIRAMPGLERLPVIVLSGSEGEGDRRRALQAGADEFLAKSQFDESSLLEAVARRLGAAA
jgi:two-component system chemotaxis sensor kinase CheA